MITPPRPLRVLLVDDHEDTNRMLTILLKRRGYEVGAATSIAEAVAAAGEGVTWDVLVSDMNLPDGSGVDLLAKLPSPPTLGGIVVSGLSSGDNIDRVTEAGYKGYLSKPVELDKLEAMIQNLAAGKVA